MKKGTSRLSKTEQLHVDVGILRNLPPVNIVLDQEILTNMRTQRGHHTIVHAVRLAISEARMALQNGKETSTDPTALAQRASEILKEDRDRPLLRHVINATGVLLHTGLGRAPLAEQAIEAVGTIARGYCNLEFNLEEGERGHRTIGVSRLLCGLTGSEAATVVNNNAAATVLALRALAAGREVIISRGQLIEIGGNFRLPEIFEVSGARLREVGTTNRTRISDYERAINSDTAAILRAHHSNFRIIGFTEETPLPDLTCLAHSRGLWMIDDIGSGALAAGRPPFAQDEPNVTDGIAGGVDLVLFSGDKLLGGPQCGILVGTRKAISLIEADPLMRALRVDKMTLAALEATLCLIRDQGPSAKRIPLWRMMETPLDEIASRAQRIVRTLKTEFGLNASTVNVQSFVGGGSVPGQSIATVAVMVSPPFPAPYDSEGNWARALRIGNPPVITRTQGGSVLFDLRSVAEREETGLLDAIRHACHD
jgi:L-seryl-tRNA(Ser) seleniumtransferase